MQTIEKTPVELAAAKVADLWAEQIQRPTNKDNGDPNGMLFMLATMNTQRAQQCLTPELIERFKAELTKAIVRQMAEGRYSESFFLSCDYSPEGILADVAQKVGIPGDCFPWKSSTHIGISRNEITARFGYTSRGYTLPITE